jgi:predicted secreted hydrolase
LTAGIAAALIALLMALAPSAAPAQGFAGMGGDAAGFALPTPDRALSFPADHAAHPGFRIEWWYVTATLEGPDGTPYGAQWTLFRTALRPPAGAEAAAAPGPDADGWHSPQIWFAHAALTSSDRHLFAETTARGGIGQAGVRLAPFEAWINDWSMAAPATSAASDSPPGADALSRLRLTARGPGFSYALGLASDDPLTLHGEAGFSLKSPRGQASHYYSQPGYRVEGEIDLGDGPIPVTGSAWLDREWSSQPLTESQTGWDWFALRLEGEAKLMVYRLRDSGGPDFTPATWIAPDGTATALPPGAVRLTPGRTSRVAGHELPTVWRVTWPEGGVDLTVTALNPAAWMGTAVSYWEGPVRVAGSHSGTGYLEMTGYDRK